MPQFAHAGIPRVPGVQVHPQSGAGYAGCAVIWYESHRADPAARMVADRHYNRQKVGTPQFAPPGRCAVFLAYRGRALWVTSWPFAEFVKHAWPGAWICSAFRNEGAGVASELIRSAVSCTRWQLGDPPALGMVSFIDRRFVRPIMVRGIPTWGRTYAKAGFVYAGETKGGLMAMQLHPADMPRGLPALTMQLSLFGDGV